MDLDHLPGYQKRFSLSLALTRAYSAARVRAEIAKCQAVCANCHRIRTAARRRSSERSPAARAAVSSVARHQMCLPDVLELSIPQQEAS